MRPTTESAVMIGMGFDDEKADDWGKGSVIEMVSPWMPV
jgi:hypothetical protein